MFGFRLCSLRRHDPDQVLRVEALSLLSACDTLEDRVQALKERVQAGSPLNYGKSIRAG